MPFGKFVQKNIVLIVGLVLPVILMGLFLGLAAMPPTRSAAQSTTYSFVFSTVDYSQSIPAQINYYIQDGRLYVAYAKTPYNQTGAVKLYKYEADTHKIVPLNNLTLATNWDDLYTKRSVVEATKNLKFDNHLTSPDGFEFSDQRREGGGIINDFFLGNSYEVRPILRKGSDNFPLPIAKENNFGPIAFIGWIIGQQ